MQRENLLHEMGMCLDLWEKQGGCMFGWGNKCEECAVSGT